MITLKSPRELEILREGGRRLASILEELKAIVVEGASSADIDALAHDLITQGGDRPAFLHYRPTGAPRPYPASVCISVNDVVVHGIPTESPITFKEGDVVTLDGGLVHKKLFTDAAITVGVGTISKEVEKLISVANGALEAGIKAAQVGNTVGDIGHAIESFVKPYGYGIVRELAGHGVGYKVHEDPYVPNFGEPGKGEALRAGMVIAIEPMLTLGGDGIILDDDGYTVRTKDGSLSVHVEHTIAVTESGPEILTRI